MIKQLNILLLALSALALASESNAQIRVDARIQMSSGSCSGCDLSNKAMNGVRLNNANLSSSNFNNSNLSGGSLDGSNLSGAHFRGALMYRVSGAGVNMPNAVLEDATLTEARLSGAKLANANLSRANLSRAVFSNSDFKGAQFDNANLTEAHFQNGQFQNADFGGAILLDANLDDADFSGANMSTVQGLKQVQLDVACGDEKTRLPVGLSLPYCDHVTPAMETHQHDNLDADMTLVAARLDRAIADVENLLAASAPRDRALRTRLQRIHSDLVQSKAALE
ncbi:MAG: pentapeptide repeat-containing protein [Litorimonas sp.]